MFVRPAPGLSIRRPDTLTLLPEGGEDVSDIDWCQRRLRDGDCTAEAVETVTQPVAPPYYNNEEHAV